MNIEEIINNIKYDTNLKNNLIQIKTLVSTLKDNNEEISNELLLDIISSSNELQKILSSIKNSDNEVINRMIELNETIKLEEKLLSENYENDSNGGLNRYFKSASKYQLLTKEEEISLAKKIADGDSEALNILVEHNLRLAAYVAKHYVGMGLEYEDLVQNANIGLIAAAKKYDYKKNCRFSTYAIWWIRHSLLREIYNTADTIRIPVRLNELLSKIDSATKALNIKNGTVPTDEEIAKYLNLSEKEVAEAKKSKMSIVSSNTSVSDESDSILEDFFEDSNLGVVDTVLYKEEKREIQKALNNLSEREKSVLILYYGLGNYEEHTLQEIGSKYGVSKERIRQVKVNAEKKIRLSKQSKSLINYISDKKYDNKSSFRVKHSDSTIYDILCDVCDNKEVIDYCIDQLNQRDKKIINIIYGDDLSNPLRDDNKYSYHVLNTFNVKVLPKLREFIYNYNVKKLSIKKDAK